MTHFRGTAHEARHFGASRQLEQAVCALMLAAGLHLALLGVLAQLNCAPEPRAFTPAADLVVSTPPPPSKLPLVVTVVEAPAKSRTPLRLARRLKRAPDIHRLAAPSRSSRTAPAMDPAPHLLQTVSVPRRQLAMALQPQFRNAPLPAGRQGSAPEAESAGEARGECIVFLYDNSQRDGEAIRLRHELLARVKALDPLQYFYVVAYDGVARRMFSDHSPELRPLPATRYNRWLLAQWLEALPESESADGANWAVVHAMQLQPAEIQVLCSGPWPPRASAYLRSTNLGPDRQPRIPLHVLAANKDQAAELRQLARDNGGTYEALIP